MEWRMRDGKWGMREEEFEYEESGCGKGDCGEEKAGIAGKRGGERGHQRGGWRREKGGI
jgi:hypothetical protein